MRTQVAVPSFEQITLCVLVQEGKVLVLPMDVYEIRRDFFEKGQRDMASVDKDRALARARHLTQNDELIFTFDFLLREQSTQFRIALIERKYRLNTESIAAAPNRVGRYSLTEDRAECVNQDGFTRTGLTGEDVEPCAELNGNLLKQRKIPDTKALQHSVSSPQRMSS